MAREKKPVVVVDDEAEWGDQRDGDLKLTVILAPHTRKQLDGCTMRGHTTKADIVRKAIAFYSYFDEHMVHVKDGVRRQAAIITADGKVEQRITVVGC